jgi:hypothetical protein
MIGRRAAVAAAGVVLGGVAARAASPEDRLAFDIMREGSRIGSHVLNFAASDNAMTVRIAVDIAVRFGPLVVFRYTLRGLEQWSGGALVHAEAHADDDGTPGHMQADRDAGGLWVSGSKAARYLAPAKALTATHWNMAELDGPWINFQDGGLLHPAVARIGTDQVKRPGGGSKPATHFALTGDARLDLWYDSDRRWSALTFTAHDGSLVRYELA